MNAPASKNPAPAGIDELMRRLVDWCEYGLSVFTGDPGGSQATHLRARRAVQVPLYWLGEMHVHTTIPIHDLAATFRATDRGPALAVEPHWRFDSQARRLRCLTALTLMPAQLVSGHPHRPGGVPMAEVKEICSDWGLQPHRGALYRTLRRADAFRINDEAPEPTVSLATVTEPGPWTLTPRARAACIEAVEAVLPIKRAAT